MDRKRVVGPETSVVPLAMDELSRSTRESLLVSRLDGRQMHQHRPLFLKRGLVHQANGSAYIESGSIKIACAVYGPRPDKKVGYSELGHVNCEFKLSTFSSKQRRGHIKDAQERDYGQIVASALTPCVRLDKYPKSAVDVFVTVLQADGDAAVLAASITVASMALVDAGIELYDVAVATSMGYVDTCLYADCTESETVVVDGELVVARMPTLGEVCHVHHSGAVDMDLAIKAIEQATEACSKIHSVMVNGLLA
jgi:exosome complex component MTR3